MTSAPPLPHGRGTGGAPAAGAVPARPDDRDGPAVRPAPSTNQSQPAATAHQSARTISPFDSAALGRTIISGGPKRAPSIRRSGSSTPTVSVGAAVSASHSPAVPVGSGGCPAAINHTTEAASATAASAGRVRCEATTGSARMDHAGQLLRRTTNRATAPRLPAGPSRSRARSTSSDSSSSRRRRAASRPWRVT